ncbi:MAG: HNH endonuclease signature motif containing protein [Gordonia sp. (in: high G+C Gram-positive bacteria)]|uniref:HNH endonuclease signature motif containing protein n=1 Tax=Gordonia sp. (in: high G+C Gram-positive bacteria) TaxID=84139 RepID=UPI003BB62C82
MTQDIFDQTAPSDLDDEQLEERVIGYASQVAALTCRMLDYLAEFDARKAWAGDGIATCANWLVWRTGMSLRTAQDHVRAAKALQTLPLMHEEFRTGRLSYSKVRALTRVATPERERELVTFAQSASAAQVERLCGAIRDIDARWDTYVNGDQEPEAEPAPPETWGRVHHKSDGTMTVTLRLNAVDAKHFMTAVVRAEYERTRTVDDPDLDPHPAQPADDSTANPCPPSDLWRNAPANIGPAVVAMADLTINALDIPETAAGAEILVHEVDGVSSVDDGPELRSAEREEMECGASVRTIGHAEGDHVTVGGRRMGPVLWWGRRRRVPNAALVRTILMRDRCCQAPGCERTRFLHIHHVTPWSQGGTTDPDNLILLCGAHHRALHHGAFAIEALGSQRFAFRGTHGGLLITAPLHAAPPDWHPDMCVERDGVTTKGGGHCDFGYTTNVLYDNWQIELDRRAAEAELTAAA